VVNTNQDQLTRDYESLYRSYVALKREVEHLSTLREITLSLNASLDLNETLTIIANVVHGALEVARLTVYEVDEDEGLATPIVAKYGADLIGRGRLEEDTTPIQGTLLQQAYTSRRNVYESSNLRHAIYAPLTADNKSVGVMVLERAPDDEPFDREDDALYSSLGKQIGSSINNAQLYALAVTDGLTGLYVRRYFDLRLDEEFAMGKRYRRCFSLMIFDIDHFKKFNDTHGHQTGDLVLQQFADLIRASTRQTDICCRYGGEEFTVILPETHLGEAETLAEKLRDRVAKQRFEGAGGEKLSVTTSIGVSTYRENIMVPQDLVKVADQALYRAKEKGRNRVEVADHVED